MKHRTQRWILSGEEKKVALSSKWQVELFLQAVLLVTQNPQTVRQLTFLGLCKLCLVISFCSILWDSGTMTLFHASYENESLSLSPPLSWSPNPHSSYRGVSLPTSGPYFQLVVFQPELHWNVPICSVTLSCWLEQVECCSSFKIWPKV